MEEYHPLVKLKLNDIVCIQYIGKVKSTSNELSQTQYALQLACDYYKISILDVR